MAPSLLAMSSETPASSLSIAWSRIKRSRLLWLFTAAFLFLVLIAHHSDSVLLAASNNLCPTYPQTQQQTYIPTNYVDTNAQTPLYADPDPFENFVKGKECNVSRPWIHHSFSPKCTSKQQLLDAMSGGGRYGFDQPYSTLGCDMKWYTTAEICEILSHYKRIRVVGDSLTRQLLVAMHILLREDLVEGGRATWRKDNPEEEYTWGGPENKTKIIIFEAQDCRCQTLFSRGSRCMWHEAMDTEQIFNDDPISMKCPRNIGYFGLSQMPIVQFVHEGIDSLVDDVNKHTEDQAHARNAFVFGSGAWQRYDFDETTEWFNALDSGLREGVPSFKDSPKLWMSPPAKAINAHPLFINVSNNILIQQHINAMDEYVKPFGYDHLRTYNLTVQTSSPDGTHTNLQNTLVEAMMILNWLDMSKDRVG